MNVEIELILDKQRIFFKSYCVPRIGDFVEARSYQDKIRGFVKNVYWHFSTPDNIPVVSIFLREVGKERDIQ